VIGGSSFGGLAPAYAGLVNARWFGNVLSMSGSYWWSPAGEAPGWVQRAWQEPRQPVRFYLDAGRYERARGGQDGILETNRHLADVLRAKGYEVTQAEHETSHDYVQWQDRWPAAWWPCSTPGALPRACRPASACRTARPHFPEAAKANV
jgi:enterochelin esterase family protein